jgi:hypothetical protein
VARAAGNNYFWHIKRIMYNENDLLWNYPSRGMGGCNTMFYAVILILIVFIFYNNCGNNYDNFDPNYKTAPVPSVTDRDFSSSYANHGDNIPVTNSTATEQIPFTNTVDPDKRRNDLIKIGNIDNEQEGQIQFAKDLLTQDKYH